VAKSDLREPRPWVVVVAQAVEYALKLTGSSFATEPDTELAVSTERRLWPHDDDARSLGASANVLVTVSIQKRHQTSIVCVLLVAVEKIAFLVQENAVSQRDSRDERGGVRTGVEAPQLVLHAGCVLAIPPPSPLYHVFRVGIEWSVFRVVVSERVPLGFTAIEVAQGVDIAPTLAGYVGDEIGVGRERITKWVPLDTGSPKQLDRLDSSVQGIPEESRDHADSLGQAGGESLDAVGIKSHVRVHLDEEGRRHARRPVVEGPVKRAYALDKYDVSDAQRLLPDALQRSGRSRLTNGQDDRGNFRDPAHLTVAERDAGEEIWPRA
jgi:hypothetical protein